ncbi:MAG TPA: hypothetical protein VE664_08620 [Actinomycetes bacterium]|nr:hypothetical protein [Actinomycetes bacterium]
MIEVALLGARIIAAVVRWTFSRPRWLFPVRLFTIAGLLVLASDLLTR